MKLIFTCVTLLLAVGYMEAKPRYIAVPAEDIQFLDLRNLHLADLQNVRAPRQATYNPQIEERDEPQAAEDVEQSASDNRPAREAHHHLDPNDYVDFGAHTGHHGSFGWYADYPVHAHGHH